MLRTVEAVISPEGKVRLLEAVSLHSAHRAIVTILDDEPAEESPNATCLLSESTLAEDWNRPEEDQAWAHLQPGR